MNKDLENLEKHVKKLIKHLLKNNLCKKHEEITTKASNYQCSKCSLDQYYPCISSGLYEFIDSFIYEKVYSLLESPQLLMLKYKIIRITLNILKKSIVSNYDYKLKNHTSFLADLMSVLKKILTNMNKSNFNELDINLFQEYKITINKEIISLSENCYFFSHKANNLCVLPRNKSLFEKRLDLEIWRVILIEYHILFKYFNSSGLMYFSF